MINPIMFMRLIGQLFVVNHDEFIRPLLNKKKKKRAALSL